MKFTAMQLGWCAPRVLLFVSLLSFGGCVQLLAAQVALAIVDFAVTELQKNPPTIQGETPPLTTVAQTQTTPLLPAPQPQVAATVQQVVATNAGQGTPATKGADGIWRCAAGLALSTNSNGGLVCIGGASPPPATSPAPQPQVAATVQQVVATNAGQGTPATKGADGIWRCAAGLTLTVNSNASFVCTGGAGPPPVTIPAPQPQVMVLPPQPPPAAQAPTQAAVLPGQAVAAPSPAPRTAPTPPPLPPPKPNDLAPPKATAVNPPPAQIATVPARAAAAPLHLDSSGTGFFISSGGQILTAQHVIDGCREVRLGESLKLPVVAQDKANDLAILGGGGVPPGVVRFRETDVRIGEQAVVAGFPLYGLLATQVNITAGGVSATAGIGGDNRDLQITAAVQPGNSGGPLLDASGAVIGVVVSKLDAIKVAGINGDIPQNINFAVKTAYAVSLARRAGVPIVVANSGRMLDTPAIGAEAQRYTVLLTCWN